MNITQETAITTIKRMDSWSLAQVMQYMEYLKLLDRRANKPITAAEWYQLSKWDRKQLYWMARFYVAKNKARKLIGKLISFFINGYRPGE